MINLNNAKKIIFKKNEDGTYNMMARLDTDIVLSSERVIIKTFEVEMLSDTSDESGDIFTIELPEWKVKYKYRLNQKVLCKQTEIPYVI